MSGSTDTTIRPDSVEHWASVKGDDIAAIEGERRLTWREWDEASNRVANALADRGIVAGDIVVARTQIRIDWLILRHALGKLGCRLLGMNWRLTPGESEYVLSNSGAAAIVLDDADPQALRPIIQKLNLKLAVSIDTPSEGFVPWGELLAASDQPAMISAGDPPLIVYTSGTTGMPKGVVMGEHRNGDNEELQTYLRSMAKRRPQFAGDVVLVTMPFHHGAGPALVRQSVRAGNLMILLRRFDAETALRLIQDYAITYWNGVPTMYKRMAGLPADVLSAYDVSSIRSLSVGAAPVTPELKAWIMDYFGECLDEGYGATETSMVSSITADMQRQKPGSVGKPFEGTIVEIRDDAGKVLPVGETGEIWVRTPVTIRSYLNAPTLDSETVDDRGLFRTGDVGHFDEDGYLYITDRVKDMIISGGVNIYPAEIEAVLLRHPAIQDAAVFGIPNDEFGEAVMAVCELKQGQSVTETELAAHCAAGLASYKCPRRIEITQDIPRNGMGKILKKDLRAPYWAGKERKV